MKKILLTLSFVSLFAPLLAQNFQFSINGGIAHNTSPLNHLISQEYGSKGSGIKPVFSVDAGYRFRNWQIGISAAYIRLWYTPKISQYDLIYNTENSSGEEWITYGSKDISLAKNAIPVSLRLNRYIGLGKAALFAGASVGYCAGSNETSAGHMSLDGYTLGAQLGCDYKLSRHFGARLQLQGNYISLSYGTALHSKYSVFDFPLTAGLTYSL